VLSIAKLLETRHQSSSLVASFHVVAQTTHVVFRGVLYSIMWFSQTAQFLLNPGWLSFVHNTRLFGLINEGVAGTSRILPSGYFRYLKLDP